MTLTVTVTIPANEETGQGTHMVGHTNYEAVPIQQGLERLWVTDKTETGFTLHTDSPSMEADVERTCLLILTGEAAATDAPYGTVANMKPLCSIQPDVTTFDAELLLFLTKAADFIHTPLLNHETTLPLTTVPAIIATIAEFYASGLYMMKNQQDEKAHSYLSYAQKELDKYVSQKYDVSVSVSPFAFGKVSASSYSEIDEE